MQWVGVELERLMVMMTPKYGPKNANAHTEENADVKLFGRKADSAVRRTIMGMENYLRSAKHTMDLLSVYQLMLVDPPFVGAA